MTLPFLFHRRIYARVLIIVIICTLLMGCGPVLPPSSASQPASNPETTLPVTEVVFRVQIPDQVSGQTVTLEILDEVTGLAFNSLRYTMKPGSDGRYEIPLMAAVGSVIKYRFLLGESNPTIEANITGQPVRYRVFYVSGPSMISDDMVLGWVGQVYDGGYGRLTGQVLTTDAAAPIAGAMVFAGVERTTTRADGSFTFEKLPPGILNLVVYAPDSPVKPFSQAALIETSSTTQANVNLSSVPYVNVTFIAKPPAEETAGLPTRLIGNINMLGNTYSDLDAGFNVIASRAPLMQLMPDGSYSLTVALPAGLDLRYKYSQGDGFWNGELTQMGHFRLRQLIIPDADITITDTIDAWTAGDYGHVTFSVKVPENTPPSDTISIQFNPYAWTPPLPMWPVGSNEWVFILNNPLHMLGPISYRYCRNDQCEIHSGADDEFGTFERSLSNQTLESVISEWSSWSPEASQPFVVPMIEQRSDSFIAGIELVNRYHPSWLTYIDQAFADVKAINAEWVVLTPGWTYLNASPMIFEPIVGRDASLNDIIATAQAAERQGLTVAIYPQTTVAGSSEEFWGSLADANGWRLWFDHYSRYMLHSADLAQQVNASALILGELESSGAYSSIASSLPADQVEAVWRDLIGQIRSRFSGELFWAVSFKDGQPDEYAWLDDVDRLYCEFLVSSSLLPEETSAEEMAQVIGSLLDEQLMPLSEDVGAKAVFALQVPSADVSVCNTANDGCLPISAFSAPVTELASAVYDLERQASVYSAALMAINEREWVSGIVSKGYYPPVAIQDLSTSIRGKPAADVLWYWFPRLTGN